MGNLSLLLLPLFLILLHPIDMAWCANNDTDTEGTSGGGPIDCSPGEYYDNSTEICTIGRVFGGILFFDTVVSSSSFALPRATGISTVEAESIVSQIYSSSLYYVESNVITCFNSTANTSKCSYQLIYKNAAAVDTDLIKSDFNSGTEGCNGTLTTISTDFDCVKSRDEGLNQTILCEEGGDFYNECDSNTGANCNVSDSGSFYCYCDTSYALPYDGATSCTEIKCEKDSDCSGGGIHGSCIEVNKNNSAYNFCQCNWGFTGNNCEDPWWFVFTVLTGAFGLLAIVILVVCICMTTKTKTVKNDTQKDDLDLKNPFVDFQPGVRAKVSTNIYSSVTDSISTPTTQGHSNPAFNNNAYDDRDKATPYAAAAQGNDYF